MGCRDRAGEVPKEAPQPRLSGPMPRVSRGPRHIPVSSQSGMVVPSAPLYKPGYTGYKPQYDIKGIGSRFLPTIGFAAAPDSTRAKGAEALGRRIDLSDPSAPHTTQPLHLASRDPAYHWVSRWPIRPGLGDARPVDGTPRRIGQVQGGAALPITWSTYGGAERAMPFDGLSRERWRAFDSLVRYARWQAKPVVRLTGGPTPTQFAQAPRINPTTPSKIRGIQIQELLRPTTLRGRMSEQDTAPRWQLERMARQAAARDVFQR